MDLSQHWIFLKLAVYAYEPTMVYLMVVAMMLFSAVGLPVPEEVTLISVGILAFMGSHPNQFPPPFPGAPVVEAQMAALIAFLAVFASDTLIYGIGRLYGEKIFNHPWFKKFISDELMLKVRNWTQKYGAYACGIFRFTPGIRFPGHLACGALKFPLWKFLVIDGFAALISVPTQILLISMYGESILGVLKEIKLVIFSALALLIVYFLYKKWIEKKRSIKN